MRLDLVTIAIAATAVLSAPAAAQSALPSWARYAAAREVQLRDIAAIIVIVPENRTDVAFLIENPGPLRAPRARLSGRRLIVDGGQRGQIRACDGDSAEEFEVVTRRQGRLEADQLPTIQIRVPQDAVVAVSGAAHLRMAPAQSAHVSLGGCGAATIDRVEDEAEISLNGSMDLLVADVGELSLAVAGSGDATVGAVRQGLAISVAGSSDVAVTRADGPTNIAVQGSGEVTIRSGRATALSVAVAGSGDVTHEGTAQSLDAVIVGAGDVRVRSVAGTVNRRVIGSGEVVVGG